MIYVHVPFCHRKCTYCAFYSTPSARLREAYVDAVLHELELRKREIANPVRTIYFGGGTPSLLGLDQLQRMADALGHAVDLGSLEEATMECNPEDLTPDFLAGIRRQGLFNRISIGVQSFDDALLRLIGRRHTARQAVEAVEAAAGAGFENITIDLIYGLPGLDDGAWNKAVQQAVALPVKHLSAYSLTVEEGTALARQVATGRVLMPDDEQVVGQYRMLCDAMRSAGFGHYEVSNFALPGYASRHNSRYWDRTPYVGLGPAAHSFDGHRRRWNVADVERYVVDVFEGCKYYEEETLTTADAHNETVMTGLRTAAGIPSQLVSRQQMQPYIERGWIIENADCYCPTEQGMLYADGMASDLFE